MGRSDRRLGGLKHLAAAALATLLLAGTAAAEVCRADAVTLRGDWGKARFSVEVADDTTERAQGLMHRRSLPLSAGMLFIYDTPQPLTFWMRNTLIPLDLLFIDDRRNVWASRKAAKSAIRPLQRTIQPGLAKDFADFATLRSIGAFQSAGLWLKKPQSERGAAW